MRIDITSAMEVCTEHIDTGPEDCRIVWLVIDFGGGAGPQRQPNAYHCAGLRVATEVRDEFKQWAVDSIARQMAETTEGMKNLSESTGRNVITAALPELGKVVHHRMFEYTFDVYPDNPEASAARMHIDDTVLNKFCEDFPQEFGEAMSMLEARIRYAAGLAKLPWAESGPLGGIRGWERS